MIEFINGKVDFISPEFIVVDVSGVGYQIYTPNPFLFQKDLQQIIKIYTYQYVREDVIALYGFETRQERTLFTKLLNVSGIGPKGAMAILAAGQPDAVVQAIEDENEKFLVKFPGVGKKTARQMILDLKGKLNDLLLDLMPDLFEPEKVVINSGKYSHDLEEAIEALKVLGYAEKEITKVIPQLQQEQLPTDQYIKKALQLLLR
ncbi:Holliday junction branch migration protein RuvA [Schinkia azotoformans]|uniref:Holliday junction branch migration protein RuvA n=1 Tax=Schinkia azotoformans TaxID=1454 RepID=UPI002DBF0CA2|nr:Holliday junction branch migration protein RuvA [Schinkia azotoformans]MEC1720310.1 Holliday junction branch migration protein RuvA [Schinkia azotoformans]MED4413313.1 Holliday junction branch migration protein RuvA [Schinkia azotoformans]